MRKRECLGYKQYENIYTPSGAEWIAEMDRKKGAEWNGQLRWQEKIQPAPRQRGAS